MGRVGLACHKSAVPTALPVGLEYLSLIFLEQLPPSLESPMVDAMVVTVHISLNQCVEFNDDSVPLIPSPGTKKESAERNEGYL